MPDTALPTTDIAARLGEYLDLLPLPADQRPTIPAARDIEQAFAELHRQLGETAAPAPKGNAASLSIARRIRMAHPGAPLTSDLHGGARLVMTPPMTRAKMLPQPLGGNPVRRLFKWVRSLYLGRRGQMAIRTARMARERTVNKTNGNGALPKERGHWHLAGLFRRLLLLVLVIGQTAYASWFMTAVLPYHGTTLLELATLIIFAILFAWVSAGFWTAMMGFWVLLLDNDRYAISHSAPQDAAIDPSARTAILVPICNENVARVFAGLRSTYTSLARTGAIRHFDFYILSDSNEADTCVAEVEAWLALCGEMQAFGYIHYRRRQHRIKKKSGNIGDFCRRWGSAYRYMVVLDADSVMSGACLVRLVQLMEANPRAGIIQTAPRASGRETMYARLQQFANRVYGPLFTAGLHFWQLGESHYWGHNAILRVAPFIQHCALGRLPGRGALSGEIMSHDFVEAALMRRAGWAVWIAYDLPGSYEEMPPTLLDELRRDRRWCQGNLQNFRLFFAQGLHPAHRAVFMTGVMAYLSAPLWFLSLVLSTALLAVHALVVPQYFQKPYQLFPVWPEWHPEWALSLFAVTTGLLFLPKILSVMLLITRGAARPYGGMFRLLGSMFLEMLFSALLAPIRMLFHARFVLTALLGLPVLWKSPPREDAETTWTEALIRHGGGTLLGIVWAAGVYWLNPTFLWWLLPIVGSLIVSIPLSVWSSRVGLGMKLREHRFFLIPEESNPPRELRWTQAALRRGNSYADGFRRAVAHPVTNAVICAAGRPRRNQPEPMQVARRHLAEKALQQGPAALNDAQRNALLNDPDSLSRLHFRFWTQPRPSWDL